MFYDRVKREDLVLLKEELTKIKDSAEFMKALPDKSVYQMIYDTNKNHLDYIAINYFGSLITYGELFERIDILSQKLKEMGVQPGEHVLVSELATPEGIVAFYALNKIGAVSHMLNPLYGKDDLVNIINENNIRKYITMDLFYSKEMQQALDRTSIDTVIYSSLKTSLPYGFNADKAKFGLITLLKTSKSKIKDDPRAHKWEDVVKKDESYVPTIEEAYYKSGADCSVAYTSGTTGTSKGVVATDRAMNAMAVQEAISEDTFTDQEVFFITLPTWIYYGLITNIHNPLYFSLTVACNPLFNPKHVDKDMNRYHFNHWDTVPAYVEEMIKNKKMRRMDLRMFLSLVTGGDYLSVQLQHQINEFLEETGSPIKVMQGYGASEVLGGFCNTRQENYTIGSVGSPMIGNKAKIVDVDTREELGVNETGELILFTPTLMSRYLNKPKETEEAIEKDENGLLWYKTGDLAHITENGEIFIDGRIRRIDMVLDENGMPAKLIPDKIKRVVEEIDQVFRCEIISVPDKKYILKPVIFIELVEGVIYDEVIEKTIMEKCLLELPEYMQPKDIVAIDKFPLRPSMKVDWSKLEEEYKSRAIEDTNEKKLKNKM